MERSSDNTFRTTGVAYVMDAVGLAWQEVRERRGGKWRRKFMREGGAEELWSKFIMVLTYYACYQDDVYNRISLPQLS